MTLKEKILFHQVHPAKLATDIIAAIVSLYFFWQHDLIVGLVTHFIPPPIGSAAVMHFANLEPYKNSRLGSYLARYMTPARLWRLTRSCIPGNPRGRGPALRQFNFRS